MFDHEQKNGPAVNGPQGQDYDIGGIQTASQPRQGQSESDSVLPTLDDCRAVRRKHPRHSYLELRDELAKQGWNVSSRAGLRPLAEMFCEESEKAGHAAKSLENLVDAWVMNWPAAKVRARPLAGDHAPEPAPAPDSADTARGDGDASCDYEPDTDEPGVSGGCAPPLGAEAEAEAGASTVGDALPKVDTDELAPAGTNTPFELTIFKKTGGPLTKSVGATSEGKLINDLSGSACGAAGPVAPLQLVARVRLCFDGPSVDRSLWLGSTEEDLKDEVGVTTKGRLLKSGGRIRQEISHRGA